MLTYLDGSEFRPAFILCRENDIGNYRTSIFYIRSTRYHSFYILIKDVTDVPIINFNTFATVPSVLSITRLYWKLYRNYRIIIDTCNTIMVHNDHTGYNLYIYIYIYLTNPKRQMKYNWIWTIAKVLIIESITYIFLHVQSTMSKLGKNGFQWRFVDCHSVYCLDFLPCLH